ncbi:ABC transporter ATP-binding protein [Streptomyces olindensis]|uniref:ABC transporter ATP-binding protein n=1 Tax=Streptomyces olindensis TaxID=358823 RepID=A0ABV2XWF1_9ACTN
MVTAAGVLLGLAGLDLVLVALVLPPLLLGLALFAAALRATAARQREVILADERVAEATGALTGGLRDVVTCGAEDRVGATAGAHVDDAARATVSLARLTAVRTAALGMSGWVPLLLIVVAAPWLIRNGVTAGAILGAVTYVSQALQPTLQGFVQGLGSSGLWLLVTVGRMAEVAAESRPEAAQGTAGSRPEPAQAAMASRPGKPAAGLPVARPGACRVDVRGLTFAYARSADPVIRDLDLLLRPGEHLAVVGPSGAGKSILAALIAGVLEPQAGQVYLDYLPLRALVGRGEGPDRHRGLVPQEADVESAVRAVGAAPLVVRLVVRLGGYDAPLDPRRLSAGERQLVALARALLPAPRLTLLDEATCHLDPLAEAVAEDAFARGPGTLIVVAHRISSALRADRVLVMDGTRIALGTHEELMATSSLYRDLVGHWGAAGASPGGGARSSRPTAGAVARAGMAAVLRTTAERILGRARTSRKARTWPRETRTWPRETRTWPRELFRVMAVIWLRTVATDSDSRSVISRVQRHQRELRVDEPLPSDQLADTVDQAVRRGVGADDVGGVQTEQTAQPLGCRRGHHQQHPALREPGHQLPPPCGAFLALAGVHVDHDHVRAARQGAGENLTVALGFGDDLDVVLT